MDLKEVDLMTINDGSVAGLFKLMFHKVLCNIADQNVDAEAGREVKLVFKIKPTVDRRSAKVDIKASCKLVSRGNDCAIDVSGGIFISPETLAAYTQNPHQFELDLTRPESGKIGA